MSFAAHGGPSRRWPLLDLHHWRVFTVISAQLAWTTCLGRPGQQLPAWSGPIADGAGVGELGGWEWGVWGGGGLELQTRLEISPVQLGLEDGSFRWPAAGAAAAASRFERHV